MKIAYVNGVRISREAVQYEFDRLARFYLSHGMKPEDVKKDFAKFLERAQEQAVGAKLLLDRAEQLEIKVPDELVDAKFAQVERQVGGRGAMEKALAERNVTEEEFRRELAKGCRVDVLIAQACSSVPEPTENDVEEYYAAHSGDFVSPETGKPMPLEEASGLVRDLLRHAARGFALDQFVAELRAKATIEYRENGRETR